MVLLNLNVALYSAHKRWKIASPRLRCNLDFREKLFHESIVNIYDKIWNIRQWYSLIKTLKERNHWRLTRILKWDRRVTLLQIGVDFRAGILTSISLTNCSTDCHWYGLSKAQALSCTVVDNTTQRFMPRLGFPIPWYWTVDDWKHIAWSDEYRFQMYRVDDLYKSWDNLTDSWTLRVNRALFKLLQRLWLYRYYFALYRYDCIV